jgi:EAL domain-containing protein (putative c-di-GMP-specific phosphodiesterase class I)
MNNAASDFDVTLAGISHLLNTHTSEIRYISGTRIFSEGDEGDFAYMIDKGYVEISSIASGHKEVLAILGPGEIFGEMAILDGLPRSATAISMRETTVIPIARDQLLDEVSRSSPITRLIMITAMNRQRSAQDRQHRDVEKLAEVARAPIQEGAQIKLVRVNAAQQLRLKLEMERATTNQEFQLAFQPIASMVDGRIAGFEALVRWPRKDGVVVMPQDFIPLAEQSGLIVPLGAWILENALLSLAIIGRRLKQQGGADTDIFMSINVSPKQLENEEDVEKLANMIEQANVNPACVKLEITEQALLIDPRMATIGLARLKATGATIAIDDFGTGYSSLSYLHRFPLDTLKIDRSFVQRIVEDEGRQRVVAAIISLARELNMDVVAEGVEFPDEANWLRSHACRYAQGYLIAKPSPFATAYSCLERNIEF